jgi:hypothetical protein
MKILRDTPAELIRSFSAVDASSIFNGEELAGDGAYFYIREKLPEWGYDSLFIPEVADNIDVVKNDSSQRRISTHGRVALRHKLWKNFQNGPMIYTDEVQMKTHAECHVAAFPKDSPLI